MEKEFLCAVDVGDDERVKELIFEMSNNTLQMAYRRTMCNIKNTECDGSESDYRSTLSIIQQVMDALGISSKAPTKKRN